MIKKFFVAAIVLFAAFAVTNAKNKVWDHDDDNDRGCSNSRRSFSNDRLNVIGLTGDGRLVCFSEFNPRNARTIGTVSGLGATDTALIGIDFRVQDGKLYGVGNGGGVYTIDTSNAVATFVNSLTMSLDGTSFGVDFNPAADRLRVISNTGQNLRHNVNPGGVTLSDGILTYTAPPAAPIAAIGVTGAAYTNNDLDTSTATTLFDIDSNLDQVSIQSPANNGILVATGKLGFDAAGSVGFDIYSKIRNGITVDVEGFASLISASDGVTRFYSISLLTGKAASRGSFRSQNQVVDIAIPLNQ
jgi:hypothetical protein